MRRLLTFRRAISGSQKVFLATLFLSFGLMGCDNSCILIVSNPGGGGGTITGSAPNCSLNTTTVSMRITSSLAPSAGSAPSIQHVFVTLRGIEANRDADAAENSSGWQELAPKLATEPMQLDLLASTGDSCEANISERVAVAADAYRQIRLQLSPNQPDTTESILQQNSCGNAGFNCVVTSDGNIRPLVLDRESSQVPVSSDHIAGGFVRIFPEAAVNLKIEFNAGSSQFIAAGESVRLVPVFTVDSQTACESASGADR
jgi:Domain of unknown function (DUF4382)